MLSVLYFNWIYKLLAITYLFLLDHINMLPYDQKFLFSFRTVTTIVLTTTYCDTIHCIRSMYFFLWSTIVKIHLRFFLFEFLVSRLITNSPRVPNTTVLLQTYSHVWKSIFIQILEITYYTTDTNYSSIRCEF